MTEMDLG
jgi:hypothetical protein